MNLIFSDLVIRWYLSHKRELPWREISDPYKIWVSEIILQQTRIAQGLNYYLRFIERFPDIASLASASENEVLLQWQGLGYYSRARNMHTAAKEMMTLHQGAFPTDYEGIRSLKGIGDYTAAAIASFAYNLPHAVLDGNVFRVLSRYFEIETPIDSTQGKKQFSELVNELLDKKKPALFNQGLMDLGATVCLPSSPKCDECPLQDSCLSLAHNSQTSYPVKGKKLIQRNRYFIYLVIVDPDNNYFLHRRDGKDIWQGLYEFPLVELSDPFCGPNQQMLIEKTLSDEFSNITILNVKPSIKHVLSHQNIHAQFVEATGTYKNKSHSQYVKVPLSELSNYAISRLTEIYLENR